MLRGATSRDVAFMEEIGCPISVPWGLVEPHQQQAYRNHSQTLERLAERGGLSPDELVAVLRDRPWRRYVTYDAIEELNMLVGDYHAR